MTTIAALALPSFPNSSGSFFTSPLAISSNGEIVGYSFSGPTGFYLDVWKNGGVTTTYFSQEGDEGVTAGVNSLGVIVGGEPNYGYLLQNGTATALSTQSGSHFTASGINSSGAIIGWIATAGNPEQAAIWQNGTITKLGTLPDFTTSTSSLANAINDSGQIVGLSWLPGLMTRATSWSNGVATDLGVLAAGDSSLATAISSNGEIAGTDGNKAENWAVTWQNGVMSRLPQVPGAPVLFVNGVNSSGVVTGIISEFGGFATHAAAWIGGKAIDLNTLLPANSGWVLSEANGINDSGQIIGIGTYHGVSTPFELTLGSNPTPFTLAASQTVQGISTPVAVLDSAQNIGAHIDGLQQLDYSGLLVSIAFTDPGTPALPMTAAQSLNDNSVLERIAGGYTALLSPSSANGSIAGLSTALGTTVVLPGTAASAVISPAGDGTNLTVTSGGDVEKLSHIQAVQFSDATVIVAQQPGTAAVTTGNITELYSAVFGREPDVSGLAYYQNYLAANSGTPLTTFATWFLQSPEYTGNAAHQYPAGSAGDAQFITDTYNNLLHRTPDSGAVPYYQKVINQFTQGLAAGTAAYAQAELQGHALVLTYFSQSAEFLSDVQVTAQTPASALHWLVLI